MADLSEIKTGERTFEIEHPATGENIGVRVTVVAYDDPKMKNVKRRILDRRLQLDARGRSFKAEEVDDNQNSLLFSAMTGWEWHNDVNGDPATFGGQVPDFNRKNVFAVFEALPWFKNQIDKALGDDKAFFDNSKPN